MKQKWGLFGLKKSSASSGNSALRSALAHQHHPLFKIAIRPSDLLHDYALSLKLNPSNPEDQKIFVGSVDIQPEPSTALHLQSKVLTDVSTAPHHFHGVVIDLFRAMQDDGDIHNLSHAHNNEMQSNIEKAFHITTDILFRRNDKVPHFVKSDPAISRMMRQFTQYQFKPSQMDVDVLQHLVQDLLTRRTVKSLIIEAVERAIRKKIDSGELRSMPTHPVADSKRMILGGHAGSGKGYLTGRLIKTGELDLEACARLTPDDYHLTTEKLCNFSVHGLSASEYSDAKHEIVSHHVIAAAEENIRQLQLSEKKSPHCLQEFIVFTKDRITKSNQTITCYGTVHDRLDLVIKGAKERNQALRAKGEARDVDEKYIIDGQRGVSLTMPAAFQAALSHKAKVRIELHDTTHIHDKLLAHPEVPIAVCDAEANIILIFSIDAFVKLNARKHLDANGNPQVVSDTTMANECFEDYKALRHSFVFIDPNITAAQSSNISDHIYAYVDASKHLVIVKPDIFNKLIAESPLAKVFLHELGDVLSLEAYSSPIHN